MNVLDRIFTVHRGERITEESLPGEFFADHPDNGENNNTSASRVSGESGLKAKLRFAEKEEIAKALKQTNGNQTEAAELLGVNRKTLHSRMRVLGLLNEGKNGEEEQAP